jgi:hypothetical protein
MRFFKDLSLASFGARFVAVLVDPAAGPQTLRRQGHRTWLQDQAR